MKGPVGAGLLGRSQPESKQSWTEIQFLLVANRLCVILRYSLSHQPFSHFCFLFSSKLFQVCRGRVVGFGGAGVSGASRASLVQAVRVLVVQTRLRPSSLTRDASSWCKPPSVCKGATPQLGVPTTTLKPLTGPLPSYSPCFLIP